MAIDAQADFAMTQAVKYLQDGNITQAKKQCTYACTMKRTAFGELFSGFLDSFGSP
jgi:hypothetical protein